MTRWQARLTLTAPLLLPAVAPSPASASASLTAPGLAPALALIALAAWGCAGWLLVVAVLTVAGDAQGTLARCATRSLHRLAPKPVRLTARMALGVTLATTVLGGSAAGAAPGRPLGNARPGVTQQSRALVAGLGIPAAAATAGGRPAARHAAPAPMLDWPALVPDLRPVEAAAAHLQVVVQQGDCLWTVAARALGTAATPARTAAIWPAWWAANRTVIGEDPDLLQPGTRLNPPP